MAVFENLNDILKSDSGDIQTMNIEKIDEFSDHPFNVEVTDDLKQSIERNGILNPILIRQKINGRYEVLSGHRRLKTAKELGYTEVPVIIKDYDDKTAIQVMIERNNQRTILRAVHKYKDSREQFEQSTHKRLIDILRPSAKTVDALTGMELPAGVEIEIKN